MAPLEDGIDGIADFSKRFNAWLRELGARKDVFLGYCSKSAGVAAQIQLRLEKAGASVHNWAMDFRAGGSILSEIENARAICSCGVFLFSEDDPLEGSPGVAAPRDNVVFEAGYFMSSKGSERCMPNRSMGVNGFPRALSTCRMSNRIAR
jgi:predicted nucleotide-binding protein